MADSNETNVIDFAAKREAVSHNLRKQFFNDRQQWFNAIIDDRAKLPKSAVAVARVIFRRLGSNPAKPNFRLCYPGKAKLAAEAGVSRRTAHRCTKALEDRNHLLIERRKIAPTVHETNVYRLPNEIKDLVHVSGPTPSDNHDTTPGANLVTQTLAKVNPSKDNRKEEPSGFSALVEKITEVPRTTSSPIQSTGSTERAAPPSSAPPPAAFLALWTARPGRTGDSYERTLGEWTKLNAEDRALAVKYMPDFAKGDRKNGSEVKDPDYRTMASTYLKNRLFKKCEEAEATIEECRLGTRSISDELAKEAYRLLGRSRFYTP